MVKLSRTTLTFFSLAALALVDSVASVTGLVGFLSTGFLREAMDLPGALAGADLGVLFTVIGSAFLTVAGRFLTEALRGAWLA